MNINTLVALVFGFFSLNSVCQSGFYFNKLKTNKQTISFKLINNLIVIPIEINGESLSFILDTGVNKTIVFDPSKNDSIHFSKSSNNTLKGLGNGKNVHAITTRHNTCLIKNMTSTNETFHIARSDVFDFSKKMGITIHGIIGYSLFKNFIVKINYKHKKITFYRPDSYTYKKCKKCVTKPITLNNNKPYIDTQIGLDTIGNELTDVKLLVDSGGSDALWLFEDSIKVIKTPNRFFEDILGEGISGHIYGNRARIPLINLGDLTIKNPTVSFLDSTSTYLARKLKKRNGSIGGRILKRFTVWFDYPNQKMILKKNKFFKDDFNYNMSGLDIVYNGMKLIRQSDFTESEKDNKTDYSSYVVLKYSYKFKPSYIVNHVVINSPADKAGLKKGDVILKLNNKASHDYSIEDILYMLEEKDHKKIKMTIDRNDEIMKFEFYLKKEI